MLAEQRYSVVVICNFELFIQNSPKKDATITPKSSNKKIIPREEERIIFSENEMHISSKFLLDKFAYKVEEINGVINSKNTASVFFPTFRRVEEGSNSNEDFREIARAIERCSYKRSVGNHKFVASVSTKDVEELIISKYADSSEAVNKLQVGLSKYTTDSIRNIRRNLESNTSEDNILAALDELSEKVESVEEERDALFASYEQLKIMVQEFISGKSIKISSNLEFGQVKNAIRAASLSAGEKQMLSFLAYNAFTESSPIIIDEPEISLHIDWQRQLVPALMKQNTNNQFIFATHSPFIYSRYPEKEVLIGDDRGE